MKDRTANPAIAHELHTKIDDSSWRQPPAKSVSPGAEASRFAWSSSSDTVAGVGPEAATVPVIGAGSRGAAAVANSGGRATARSADRSHRLFMRHRHQ